MKPFIYVALDLETQEKAYLFAERLSAEVPEPNFGFKLNLDAMLDFSDGAVAPRKFIERMRGIGRSLFVDLKMWNGGRTMARIAKGCADCGVDLINMYPHAMGNFVRKVVEALEGSATRLFTLTVLTHYTDDDARTLYGMDLKSAVRSLAVLGIENGAHGVIVPGTQLEGLGTLDVPKLVPAVRPAWYTDTKANDQEQAVTPEEAVKGGAQYLVVGSPILKDKDPSKALDRVLGDVGR